MWKKEQTSWLYFISQCYQYVISFILIQWQGILLLLASHHLISILLIVLAVDLGDITFYIQVFITLIWALLYNSKGNCELCMLYMYLNIYCYRWTRSNELNTWHQGATIKWKPLKFQSYYVLKSLTHVPQIVLWSMVH